MQLKKMALAVAMAVGVELAPTVLQAAEQGENALDLTVNRGMIAAAGDAQSEEKPGVAREDEADRKPSSAVLEPVTVTGERSRDEKSHDDVYMKNVTTVFKDRKELSNFQVANPGDVFKGMNGVYSMDTRSSQAITPNIRGISGEGRVPLLIDGTEQSTNVWLHMFGVGNRSYADPALFRSVEVEKGPSLTRGIKSGVGGAVNIRTIEASDIIPEGDHFGIELNLEASGNASKPRWKADSFFGKDYRDVPGAERINTTDIFIPYPPPRERSNKVVDFSNHTGMVAVAARNELTDFLVSYSKRKQGNYYAGKKNADKYAGHDAFNRTTTNSYFPNLTKLYYAGDEIFNTASETETTLVKNSWYLPRDQKISLQYMTTNMNFGETTPGDTVLVWALREGLEQSTPGFDWTTAPRFVTEKPHSELKVDRYRLGYDIKPEGSDWLNLETSLWHTRTKGTRYQTGLHNYTLDVDEITQAQLNGYDTFVSQFPEFKDFIPVPEHDGTIVAGGRQWTSHDRTGFDFSNLMKLRDNLQLTIGGSFQRENLDDKVEQSRTQPNGLFPSDAGLHLSTDYFGPRSGERKEYSAMFNLDWQPADWLALSAGTRYIHYSGKDTGLAKRRAEKNEKFKAARRVVGVALDYGELLTDAEVSTRSTLGANQTAAAIAAEPYMYDYIHNGILTPEVEAYLTAQQAFNSFLNGRTISASGGLAYWDHEIVVPVRNGKLDASQNPFANGELDINETINAQGVNNAKRIVPLSSVEGSTRVYEVLDEARAWEMPAEQSGGAWSPVLSATARIVEYGTGFLRYAQTTRFPSLYELTSGSIVNQVEGTMAIDGASKPERSTNWEIGYTHDLTQFLPRLESADVRLSYYNTVIRDFIDRNRYLDTVQFDKKKTSGLELQSRFDTGRFFGGLGANYRLKQKLCDRDFASGMDPYYNRIPSCMTGGFAGTYTGSSLQPKYSIDMALGTRLLNGRLELGWRGVYHSKAENKQLDRLLSSKDSAQTPVSDIWFWQGTNAFYWPSVFLQDVYARFEVDKWVTLNLNVTNLTDQYYIDPMSRVLLPGPGRTLTAGLKIDY